MGWSEATAGRREKRRGRTLSALAVGAGMIAGTLGLVASPGAEAAPDLSALQKDTPYVRLFTEATNCPEIRQVNELSGAALDARLAQLLSWYSHFHAEASNMFQLGDMCKGRAATTLATKLAERGAMVSNYRNGSYVSQSSASQPLNFGEAADLETRAPLAVGTYWAGNAAPYVNGDTNHGGARLVAALDGGATTVRVTSAAANRPPGAPSTWPFVNSRGSGLDPGAHSASTRDFVSWVRVDNELMQIVANPVESGGVVTLTVNRGLWGTGATAHAAATRVESPLYIGSTSAVASDSNLAGGPNRNDPNYPLRYGIKIWQANGWGWIADRIAATFGNQGYNAAWLDVSSCAQYNNADAWGQPVAGWDASGTTKLLRDRWGAHQQTKLAGLRSRFPGWKFAGNNLGGNFNTCTDDLLGNGYEGGVLEHWMKGDANWALDWAGSMGQNFDIQANNWPGIYWVRWNYDSQLDPDTYKRFSYGSLLLAVRPTADRYQYGGPWHLSRPDDLYFWDWGTPLTTPDDLSDVAVPGTGLYKREFANGVVVVNPGSSAQTLNLDSTHYEVGAGDPRSMTSVRVPAKDAVFLLKDTAGGPAPDTQAPDTAVTAPGGGQPLPFQPVSVEGSASDDKGVTGVRVTVRDTTSGTSTSYDATLASPGAATTTWRLDWTPATDGAYSVTAVAKDAAGNTDLSPASAGLTVLPLPDQTPANGQISAPSAGASVPNLPVTVSGGATDDRSVSGVKVAVRDTTTGAMVTTQDATLSDPGAPSTGWSLTWTPAQPATGYSITATASDSAGNADPTPPVVAVTSAALPDQTPAEGQITTPISGASVPNQTVTVSGAASDDRGVAGVKVAVRDTATGSVSTYDASLTSPGARSTGWNLAWTPAKPATAYTITATARDSAGNADPTPPVVAVTSATVSVPDTKAPNGTVTSPASNAKVALGPVTLGGSATDNVGVAEVRIGIRNTKTGLYLQPDGSWAVAWAYRSAELARPGATNTTWSYGWSAPPAGSYSLIVFAHDAAANKDASAAYGRFTVVAPTASRAR